ncbi:MAG: hypothetical protein NC394_02465 [Bacteroides sp.]|nr:hypothetical protein [Bacteroides sp.]
MTNEETLYTLICVYNKLKTNKATAEYLEYSRNTVSKAVNRYLYLKDDIVNSKDIKSLVESVKLHKLDSEYDIVCFCRSPKAQKYMKRLNAAYKNTLSLDMEMKIKEYCVKYLNYYIADRSILEYINAILENIATEYGLTPNDVKHDILSPVNNRSLPNSVTGFTRVNMNKKYKNTVKYYRHYNRVKKNYEEVYHKLKEDKDFKERPFSYALFYKYARKYWGNKTFDYDLSEVLKKAGG